MMITLFLTSLVHCVPHHAHEKKLKDVTWKETKRDISEGMSALGDKIAEGAAYVTGRTKKAARNAKKEVKHYEFEHHRAALEKAIEKAKEDNAPASHATLEQIGKDIRQLEKRIKEYTKSCDKRYPGGSAEKSDLIQEAKQMLHDLERLRKSCEVQ